MIVRKIVAGALAGVSAALGLAACGERGGHQDKNSAPAPVTTRPTRPWSPPAVTPKPETDDAKICDSFEGFQRTQTNAAQKKLADDFKANPGWSWDDPQIRVDALAFVQNLKDFSWQIDHFVSKDTKSDVAGFVRLVGANADDIVDAYENHHDDKKKFVSEVQAYWPNDNLAFITCVQLGAN